MDLYRSKREKLELLDEALRSFDGNAITAVILFLRRSLSESLFREILLEKSVAADHYVAYLKEVEDFDQLATTLLYVHSMLSCQIEFSILSSNIRISYFTTVDCSKFKAADESGIKMGRLDVFKEFPKSISLIGQPLLSTLYYCCLYHYDLPVNAFASPLSLKEVFQICEKQYVWMAVSALSRTNRWTDIERLLTSKKLLGGSKIVCPFGWRRLFDLLTADRLPPKDVIFLFLIRILLNFFHRLRKILFVCSHSNQK
ncbi:unnamed protein product [Anisakis simplex]|uniref:Spermatogenesis-defective protein 39 (inferred by orthology to a C. elegans protein) n=1 Tax=Anisakis simplex TaxID=6269 RepID=A0A0M3KF42_ANISI|nr:unnamed protein product [Anisakis simplex]